MALKTLVAALAVSAALATPSFAADKYRIDPQHVWLNFAIQQNVWSKALGRFTDIQGEIVFDQDDVSASSVTATIGAASADTADAGRDAEVRGEFLSAGQFPKITFASTAIEKTGDKQGTITGDLTLNGVTHPVTLAVVFNAAAVSPFSGKAVVGFSATGTLNTDDFNIRGLKSLKIGPDVSFNIEVQAVKE